jgi:hypothetical protein
MSGAHLGPDCDSDAPVPCSHTHFPPLIASIRPLTCSSRPTATGRCPGSRRPPISRRCPTTLATTARTSSGSRCCEGHQRGVRVPHGQHLRHEGRTLSLRIMVTAWSLLRSSAHSRLWQRQPPLPQRQPSYSSTQRSKSRKSSKCSRGTSLAALSRWRCSRMCSSRMGHSAAIETLDTTTTPASSQ